MSLVIVFPLGRGRLGIKFDGFTFSASLFAACVATGGVSLSLLVLEER